MIWDFVGPRPLPFRDYVVSIKGGQKFGDSLCDRIRPIRSWTSKSVFRYNFAKHELAKLLIIYMKTRNLSRSKPHDPRPAEVGSP